MTYTVRLPEGLVPTKYSGYFWHIDEQVLYSIKPSGKLHKMRLYQPNRWNMVTHPYYAVSVDGQKRAISTHILKRLQELEQDHIIEFEENENG